MGCMQLCVSDAQPQMELCVNRALFCLCIVQLQAASRLLHVTEYQTSREGLRIYLPTKILSYATVEVFNNGRGFGGVDMRRI